MTQEYKQTSPDSGKSLIVSNTIYNIVGSLFTTIVYFILVPFILYYIGDKSFGIWVIVGLVNTFLGLLNWSFGVACVKYVAEFLARKEIDRINSLFSTGLFFNIIVYMVVAPIAYKSVNILAAVMRLPSELQADAFFVLRASVIIYSISNSLIGFQALQSATQRMDVTNRILVATFTLKTIGFIFALYAGYGIRGLILVEGATVLLSSFLDIIMAFRLIEGLRVSFSLFSNEMLSKLLRFGSQFQVSRLEELVLFQTDKLFISHFVGMAQVTFYQLGFQPAAMLRGKLALLASAIMPSISDLQSRGENDRIRNIYNRGTKYIAVIVIPVFVLLFFLADELLFVWLGKMYLESSLVTRILVPCFLLNLLAAIGTAASLGMDAPDIQMKAAGFEMVFNFILTWILVIKIGYIGAALATSIALGISTIYFIVKFHDRFKIPYEKDLIMGILKPLGISILLAFPLYFLGKAVDIFQIGRVFGFFYILVVSGVFLLVYALVIFKVGVFDEYDRGFFRHYVERAKGKLFISTPR